MSRPSETDAGVVRPEGSGVEARAQEERGDGAAGASGGPVRSRGSAIARSAGLALGAGLLLLGGGPAMASFVVSPMEHHLAVPAGTRGTVSLSIRNTGERSLSLRLYLADSTFGPDGQEEDVALGVLARSCAPWVDLEADLLDLAPGELRQVALDLTPSAEASGSYWTKVYIEEVSVPEPVVEEHSGRRYQVFMRQRMGVRIFQEVPGTVVPELVVTNVDVALGGESQRMVALTAENRGNSLLRCQGWVELRTSRGELVETVRPSADGRFLVFPEGRRIIRAGLPPNLEAGTYSVLAIVDYGGESLVAGEQVLTIGAGRARRGEGVAGGTP